MSIMNLMTNGKLLKMKNREILKFDTAMAMNELLKAAVKESGLKGEEAQTYEDDILALINDPDDD